MKPKKSKPRKRPYTKTNSFHPKTSHNMKGRTISTNTPNKDKSVQLNFMDSMKMLSDMAGDFSQKSNEIHQMIQAFQSFSRAFQDQNSLKQMIGALAKLNQSQLKPNSSKGVSNTKSASEEKKPLMGGADTLFDLINSPGISDLVKTVLNSRSKKKK